MECPGIESRDSESAMGFLLAQAFLRQGAQRLPQGRPADAELGGECHLPQALARMQITGDDGPAHGIDDPFARGRASGVTSPT